MLYNLIKHNLRSFKRQNSHIIIDVVGLLINIACSLLIILFAINDASSDKYNTKKERIFRLILNGKISGQGFTTAWSPPNHLGMSR
jgi:putative ABC transport system permease protein